jgi:hypothetical protein
VARVGCVSVCGWVGLRRFESVSQRSKGSAGRLDRPGADLPWALFSIPQNALECKGRGRAVARHGHGVGGVCSRGVSSGSSRLIRKPGTATDVAVPPRSVGAVGVRAGPIGPARKGKSGGVSNPGVTASGCASGKPSRRESRSLRARASAQPKFRKIPKFVPASAPAAMNCSCGADVRRCRRAAGACADRRYDVSGNVKRGGVVGSECC